MENEFLTAEPAGRGEAFLTLLIDAVIEPEVVEGIELQRGDVLTSSRALAKRWKWTRKKVLCFLEALEREGMIRVHKGVRRGRRKGVRITICNYNKYQDKGSIEGATNRATKGAPSEEGKKGEGRSSSSSPPEIQKKERLFSGFAVFWEAYPRKVAKKRAFDAWMSLDPPIEEVLRALATQRKGWHDPKFIPYPATWLNGQRWRDGR